MGPQQSPNNKELILIALTEGGRMRPKEIHDWVEKEGFRQEWTAGMCNGAIFALFSEGKIERNNSYYRVVAGNERRAAEFTASGQEPSHGQSEGAVTGNNVVIPNNQELVLIALTEGGPMRPTQIREWILAQKLRPEYTPGMNNGAIFALRNGGKIEKDGKNYIVVPGNEVYAAEFSASGHEPSHEQSEGTITGDLIRPKLIPCYGMNWHRDQVEWDRNHNLIGRDDDSGVQVNFANQIGVYVLYEWPNVTYVGRTTRGRMYQRLLDHATNQSGRWQWDRFSWFGMLSVGSDGKLASHRETLDTEQVTTAMETLLITVLSPPLNDKSGDHLGTRYYQVPDDVVEERKLKVLAAQIGKLMGQR